MPRQLIAVALVFVSTSAAAEFVPMTGQAIRDTAVGATIELDTPVGTKIPIKHAEDGTVTGDAGSLAYILGAARDTGRWWVAEDKLCHQWSKWFDGETYCLRLKKEGRHVEWRRDDGKTGTATIISRSALLARQSGAQSGIGLDQPAAALLDAPPPVMPRASIAMPSTAYTPAAAPPETAKAPRPAPPAPKPRVAALAPQAPTAPVAPTVAPKAAPTASAVSPPPKPPARAVANVASTASTPAKAAALTPQQPAVTAPAVISFRVAGVASSDVLNVRNGPSSEHDPIGAIPPDGRDVRVVGPCQQDWCPVRHNGIGGWVNSYYLAEDIPGRGASTSNYTGIPPQALIIRLSIPLEIAVP